MLYPPIAKITFLLPLVSILCCLDSCGIASNVKASCNLAAALLGTNQRKVNVLQPPKTHTDDSKNRKISGHFQRQRTALFIFFFFSLCFFFASSSSPVSLNLPNTPPLVTCRKIALPLYPKSYSAIVCTPQIPCHYIHLTSFCPHHPVFSSDKI